LSFISTSINDQLLERIRSINVNRSGDRRAPHKPLLLLVAIAKLLQGQRELGFREIESLLRPLLNAYAPPVSGQHEPKLPYWHLRSDQLWEIPGAAELPLQQGGFPQMEALRGTSGHLPEAYAKALLSNESLVANVVQMILDAHFPESLHDDILAAVGLTSFTASIVAEEQASYGLVRKRDPRFREMVLRAYEHRCAVTGFQAALGGSYFGCEAAHVKWHAYEGPDTLENGLAMEPTLHKLFDAGAWSLTDDRRILVSADFTGTDEAVMKIRGLHGKPLRDPQPSMPLVSVEFIRWHREKEHGGVFRQPALCF
jgi:putative restriction endonuclease